MDHEAAQALFSELEDGELAPPARAELEAHLTGCEACRGELEAFRRNSPNQRCDRSRGQGAIWWWDLRMGRSRRSRSNLVHLKGCQIVGVFWGAFVAREPEKHRANADAIFAPVAAGRLRPHVDTVMPFARAGEALTRMERREVMGKLVLVP